MAVWMVFSALMGIGFWALVVGVCGVCRLCVDGFVNAMAVILDEFSAYGRNGGVFVNGHFPLWYWRYRRRLRCCRWLPFTSAWPMIWSCAAPPVPILFFISTTPAVPKR